MKFTGTGCQIVLKPLQKRTYLVNKMMTKFINIKINYKIHKFMISFITRD